jgi:hypothetical protein
VPYQVIVIGAGFGGTWRDNTYPGLTCDIPSHLYSYSFRPWHWTRRFPPREEILAYLHALAAERSLGPHLRFKNGVATAEFDEPHAIWNLTPQRRQHAPGALSRPPACLRRSQAASSRCRSGMAAGRSSGRNSLASRISRGSRDRPLRSPVRVAS